MIKAFQHVALSIGLAAACYPASVWLAYLYAPLPFLGSYGGLGYGVWSGLASVSISVIVLIVCLCSLPKSNADGLIVLFRRAFIVGGVTHVLNLLFVWIMAYLQRNVPQTL